MIKGNQGVFTILCLVTALVLAFAGRLPAQRVSMGVYISSLFDISPAESSFFADFTVWTNQKRTDFNPLDDILFPRAKSYSIVYQSCTFSNGVQWSLRRYRGTFFHDWNLRDFPFDKHRLKIQIRNSDSSSGNVTYAPDTEGSGLGRQIDLTSWSTSGFQLRAENVRSGSTFGNPAAGSTPGTSSWVTATFIMKRDAPWVFLKLVVGGYVAFAAALVACMMKTSIPPLCSGRMVLQISSLFAALLSNRAADFALGRIDQFTLPNRIHLIIYFMIFATMLVTLRSRALCELGKEQEAQSFERHATIILTAIFVIANVALIWRSAVSPVFDN